MEENLTILEKARHTECTADYYLGEEEYKPMTLEQAIKHAKEVAASKCDECGKEHQQLATWLQELQSYKDKTPISDDFLIRNEFEKRIITNGKPTHTLHNEPLTPEILTAAGWDDLVLTKAEKVFEKIFFDPSVKMTSLVKVSLRPLCNKIKIDFSDKNAYGEIFTKLITVGEFNTILDIVKLEKFKIK